MSEKVPVNAPVILFAYNRPDLLRRTLDALEQNELAAETDVIAYSDGPRNSPEDRNLVAQVRAELDKPRKFHSLIHIDADRNKGLANSIIDGITESIEKFNRVIVLEDDLLPSPFFLRYMNDALNQYENDERIASIHAHFPASPDNLPETFFLCGANCWGWATWKRSWSLFERDGRILLKKLKQSGLQKRFDYNGSYTYSEMLKSQVRGNTESWAIRWYASTFLAGKLTLNTAYSLVYHTGFQSGTHFSANNGTGQEEEQFRPVPVSVETIPVECSAAATAALEAYYREITWLPPAKRFLKNVRDFVRNATPAPVLRFYRKLKKQCCKS